MHSLDSVPKLLCPNFALSEPQCPHLYIRKNNPWPDLPISWAQGWIRPRTVVPSPGGMQKCWACHGSPGNLCSAQDQPALWPLPALPGAKVLQILVLEPRSQN